MNKKTIDSSEVFKNWERKDRIYKLIGDGEPPYRQIRTRHISRAALLIFDDKAGYQRELRYATNQKSPFVDEQDGFTKVSHIGIQEGILEVPAHQLSTQHFLHVHPDNQTNGGIVFYEFNPDALAEEENKRTDDEVDALIAVKQLTDNEIEFISFTEFGERAFSDSIKILNRELYKISKENPSRIIDLINNKHVMNRGLAGKAIYHNVLKLADNDRTVKWGSKKIAGIPVNKTPTEAIADYLLTDEGHEVKIKLLEKVGKL